LCTARYTQQQSVYVTISHDTFIKMGLLEAFWGISWEPDYLTKFEHAEFD